MGCGIYVYSFYPNSAGKGGLTGAAYHPLLHQKFLQNLVQQVKQPPKDELQGLMLGPCVVGKKIDNSKERIYVLAIKQST